MDKNKRRSSIKKICLSSEEFDGPIRVASKRQKRRISFSGKKSIREFSGEEEPKIWNHSYEVSDHIENSGGDGQSAIGNGQSGAQLLVIPTRDSHKMQQKADKENYFGLQFVTAVKLVPSEASTASTIQKSNHSSTLLIDNSVDITLLEREKNHRCHLRTISPSKSFSMSENELIMLRERKLLAVSENTITFTKELIDHEEKGDAKPAIIKLEERQQEIYDEFEKTNICAQEMIESLYTEGNGESTKVAPTTIIMDETINTESESRVLGTLTRRTMQQMQDMDISLGNVQHQQPQQNFSDMPMEISLKSPTFKRAEPINILDIKEQQSITLLLTSSCDNMEVSLAANILDDNSTKTSNSDTMEISIVNEELQACQQNCIEPKEKKPCNGNMKENVAPKVIVGKICTPIMHKESDYMNFGKQRLRRLNEGQLQDQLEKKSLSVQKVVNIETPKAVLYSHKNSGLNFSLQSLDNGFFSPEISSPLFPPEYVALSSKKLTFRQINDDIERGKIKIFPEIPEASPDSKRGERMPKKIFSTTREDQLQSHDLPKCKSVLNFEKDMETSAHLQHLPERLFIQNICGKGRKYFSVNDKGELAGKKNRVRYSQADDMLLDNTSFLTHAKLGDESVSRSNSKCSTSSRRETIIFNTEIEMEKNENSVGEGDPITMDHGNSTYKQNQICSDEVNDSIIPNAEIADAINNSETLSNKNKPKRSSIFDIKNMSLDESSIGGLEATHKQEKSSRNENSFGLKVSDCVSLHLNSRQNNDSAIDMQIDAISPTKMPGCQDAIINENCKNRQTLYFNNDADIISENLMDMSIAKSTMANETLKLSKLRVTPQSQTFTKNNNLSLENLEPIYKFNDPKAFEYINQEQLLKDKPLNAAKVALGRKSSMRFKSLSSDLEDSLTLKLNETRAATFSSGKKKALYLPANNDSPIPNRQEEYEGMRRLCEGTPHRSVIEFEYLEREANIEQQLFEQTEKSKQTNNMNESEIEVDEKEDKVVRSDVPEPLCKTRRQTNYEHADIVFDESGIEPIKNVNNTMNESPIVNDPTKKRLTANLTPIFPLSKKMRQTVLFKDCSMEESFDNENEMNTTNVLDRSKKYKSIRQTLLFHKSMILSNSGVKYEDVEKDVHIPMDITCGNKSTKSTIELNVTTQLDHTIQIENDVKVKTETEQSPSLTFSNLVEAKHVLNNGDAVIYVSPVQPSASRIPVRVESAKKRSLITESFQSPVKIEESNENHSLATIEIPRRITTFVHAKDLSIRLPMPDNDEQSFHEQLKQQRSIFSVYEDNPITISDVSVFYLAQKESTDANHEDNTILGHTKHSIISTQLQLPISNMTLRKSSLDLYSDNTINRKTNFKNYLNLSRNISLSAEVSDIDQTRLSLVESLLYEDNELSDSDGTDDKDSKSGKNENKTEDLNTHNSKLSLRSLKGVSMCRKCKRCQETLLDGSTSSTADSFALPSMPLGSGLNWDRLEKLRKRPTLADVHEYWRKKKLERPFDIANFWTNGSNVDFEDDEEDVEAEADTVDTFIQNYRQKMERVEEEIIDSHLKTPAIKRESFVKRLNKMLCESLPNWIFDYQMQHRNLLQFSHKKIVTFHILITYEEKDLLGKDIQIRIIQLQNSRFPKKNWKPIDFVMDFQLKLELPFNLESMCEGSNDMSLFKMLQEIDRICGEVAQLGYDFWRIVRFNEAKLIRDANRTYVRKIIREVVTTGDEYPRVKNSEFLIEVANLKKLSFRDIASPPLYTFREDIQFLPTGLEFLCIFLSKPFDHLKNLAC